MTDCYMKAIRFSHELLKPTSVAHAIKVQGTNIVKSGTSRYFIWFRSGESFMTNALQGRIQDLPGQKGGSR